MGHFSRTSLAWAAVLGFALGCGKKTSPREDGATPAASASATGAAGPSASAPAAPPPLPGSAAADPMGSLFGTMGIEAKTRPAITPSSDDAFAAFAKAGLAIDDLAQSLGSTYKARYCKHGITSKKDLAVLVCEYGDADAAATGLVQSNAVFTQLKRRHSWGHKMLMMAIIQQQEGADAATLADQKKLVTIFNGL